MNNETMTNQTEHFDDELLSAYVDGELTGEELAQVEQHLADDPRAQQLVNELRALSQEIQSLPPQAVGDDLRATILQRAERAMLLGTEEQQTSRPPVAGSSRRWMWPAMALAATLLLTVFLPNAQQEEKPLASAKPVPGEPPRAEPRLEAVGAEADVALGEEIEARAGEVLADSLDKVDAPPVFRSRASVSSARSSAPSSAPSGAGFATAEAMSKPIADESQPDFQVFLTLSDSADGIEPFNQLLVSNGIALESNINENSEDNSEDNIEEDENQSSPEDKADRASTFAKSRPTKEHSETQLTLQEEVVLVEATTEQIENLLEAYNADVQNFASVRLATEQKTTSLPLEKWQQWERSGKKLAQNKLRDLRRAKKSAAESQRGRAMRLNTNQYQYQANGQYNLDRKLLAKGASAAESKPQTPVQVLFILQRASGEPASAGGNR